MLTFALGLGSALNAPAWQAMVPELVPREDLTAAIALGGINYNAARAIGPALGGVVVAWAGAGATFALNAASFLAVIAVLYEWERVPRPSLLPAERMFGAMRAGLRYVRYAPALRATLVRTAAFTIGGSAVWAVLPLVARFELGLQASGYGLLLAFFGIGAMLGGASMPAPGANPLAQRALRRHLGGVRAFDARALAHQRDRGCVRGDGGQRRRVDDDDVAAQRRGAAFGSAMGAGARAVLLPDRFAGRDGGWQRAMGFHRGRAGSADVALVCGDRDGGRIARDDPLPAGRRRRARARSGAALGIIRR